MQLIKTKKNDIFLVIFIFFLAPFLLWFLVDFDVNINLSDDNLTQWLPVIDFSFEGLLHNELPAINPYQHLGIPTASVGYYGLFNPLMLGSFLLGKFFFIQSNTISIYIFLSYSIGLSAVFLLGRKMSVSRWYALLITLAYAVISTYFYQGHWYYVWNNFFIVPIILITLLKIARREAYSSLLLGFILAFSLYLGNAQYVAYQLLILAIIALVLLILSNARKYWLISFLKSGLIFIILTFPIIIFIISEIAKFADLKFGLSGAFFAFKMDIFQALLSFNFPLAIVPINHWLKTLIQVPIFDLAYRNQEFFLSGLFSVSIIGSLILIYQFIYRTIKKHAVDDNLLIGIGCFFSVIFLLIFMMGKDYYVADILSSLPVIHSFRYLFKIMYVLPPLIVLLSFIPFQKFNLKSSYFRLSIVIFLIANIIFGYLNLNNLVKNVTKPDIESVNSYIRSINLDTENYRIIGIEDDYPKDWIQQPIEYLSSMNMATYLHFFTLAGYQVGIPKINWDLLDKMPNAARERINLFKPITYDNFVTASFKRYENAFTGNIIGSSSEYVLEPIEAIKVNSSLKNEDLFGKSFLIRSEGLIPEKITLVGKIDKVFGDIIGSSDINYRYWSVRNGQLIFLHAYLTNYFLELTYSHPGNIFSEFAKSTSLKYLISEKGTQNLDNLITFINTSDSVKIKRISDIPGNRVVIELSDDIPPLVTTSPPKSNLKFSARADGYDVHFSSKENLQDMRLAFAYNENYQCDYLNENNDRFTCSLSNENGFIVAKNINAANGIVHIRYVNIWLYLSYLSSIVCFLSIIIFSLWSIFSKQKISTSTNP